MRVAESRCGRQHCAGSWFTSHAAPAQVLAWLMGDGRELSFGGGSRAMSVASYGDDDPVRDAAFGSARGGATWRVLFYTRVSAANGRRPASMRPQHHCRVPLDHAAICVSAFTRCLACSQSRCRVGLEVCVVCCAQPVTEHSLSST